MDTAAILWARNTPCRQKSDKLILMILASYGRRDGDTVDAWPSVETLIENSGLSESTVYRSIDRLCEDGLIERLPHTGARKSNTYRLNVPHPENEQAPKNAKSPRRQSAVPSRASHGQTVSPPVQTLPVPDACGIRGRDFAATEAKRHAAA